MVILMFLRRKVPTWPGCRKQQEAKERPADVPASGLQGAPEARRTSAGRSRRRALQETVRNSGWGRGEDPGGTAWGTPQGETERRSPKERGPEKGGKLGETAGRGGRG